MAVRFDPHHEAELPGSGSQTEKIRMGQRLAAGQGQIEHLQIPQIGKEREILLGAQRLTAQGDVVVAEEAVEIAAVGQLDEDGEEDVVAPSLLEDLLKPHRRSP